MSRHWAQAGMDYLVNRGILQNKLLQQRLDRGNAPAAPAASPPGAPGGGMAPGAKSAWETAIAQYAPGGGFGKGVEAGLERGRVKAIASGTQSMVSAGLAGTSMPAGLGKKYEEEVAAPARGRVESQRAQAIASLQAGYAQAQQGTSESAANRGLQERLAQLSSQTQLQTAPIPSWGGGGSGGRSGGSSTIPAYSYGASRTPDVKRYSSSRGPTTSVPPSTGGRISSAYNVGGTPWMG